MTLHGQRGRDRVRVVYSRSAERGEAFSERWGIPESHDRPGGGDPPPRHRRRRRRRCRTTSTRRPSSSPRRRARRSSAPSRSAARPRRRSGCSRRSRRRACSAATSRTCATRPRRSRRSRRSSEGAIGDVTWVRSRETHPGPHCAWFWDGRLTGGGAIIDLGCHCIEIIRNFVGKGNRPVEVMCHTDTLVHPIADEDNAIALIRFESGAIGQFEVSWTFRGGMDLRDEVAGTHGTIWLNHFLRTGLRDVHRGRRRRLRRREGRDDGRLALPGRRRGLRARLRRHVHATCSTRWTSGRAPQETFYDGYVVNAIMDACYRSAKSATRWEPVDARLARRRRRRGSPRTPRCTRARSSSSARSCPTAATS